MLIYADLGVIAFILLATYVIVSIFSIDIVGLILAHLLIIIAITAILGLLYGLFYDWLSDQKTVWLASAITAPCVYIFPFLIAIGYLTNNSMNLVKFIFFIICFLLLWIVLWIIRIIAMKLSGISNPNDNTAYKVLKPLGLFALQTAITFASYYLLIV